MSSLRRIISGGQSGADFGALRAGKVLGLETGGWMPKGFRTEEGPAPWKGTQFGLREHPSAAYQPRTKQNILDTDATVIFGDLSSPGSRLTLVTAKLYRPWIVNPEGAELQAWIDCHTVTTLNVAGNRESTNPGIEAWVFKVLVEAFGTAEQLTTILRPLKVGGPRLTRAEAVR